MPVPPDDLQVSSQSVPSVVVVSVRDLSDRKGAGTRLPSSVASTARAPYLWTGAVVDVFSHKPGSRASLNSGGGDYLSLTRYHDQTVVQTEKQGLSSLGPYQVAFFPQQDTDSVESMLESAKSTGHIFKYAVDRRAYKMIENGPSEWGDRGGKDGYKACKPIGPDGRWLYKNKHGEYEVLVAIQPISNASGPESEERLGS